MGRICVSFFVIFSLWKLMNMYILWSVCVCVCECVCVCVCVYTCVCVCVCSCTMPYSGCCADDCYPGKKEHSGVRHRLVSTTTNPTQPHTNTHTHTTTHTHTHTTQK